MLLNIFKEEKLKIPYVVLYSIILKTHLIEGFFKIKKTPF